MAIEQRACATGEVVFRNACEEADYALHEASVLVDVIHSLETDRKDASEPQLVLANATMDRLKDARKHLDEVWVAAGGKSSEEASA